MPCSPASPGRAAALVAGLLVLLVAGLIRPATGSALSNVGASAVTGSVHFTQQVPPAGAPCAPTRFTLSGSSPVFTLTTVNPAVVSGYVGPLSFSGSGGSSCEAASGGSGGLTLSATGSDSVRCPTLSGSYSRVAADVQVTLGGSCTVNGVAANVVFAFHGEFVPTNSGGGVTAPISDATFAGAVLVIPA